MSTEIMNTTLSSNLTVNGAVNGEKWMDRQADRKSQTIRRKRKLEKRPADTDSEEDDPRANLAAGGPAKQRKRSRNKGRRARRRRYKGYYEMDDKERTRMEERQKLRVAKIRERMMAKGHMLAPYNSTQFLMADHDDVDLKLQFPSGGSSEDLTKTSPVQRKRGRDSSFSLESDDDYFYSSPDDEEEFLSNEFKKDYETGNVDRLEHMDKTNLIQEYLGMEKKVESLEKTLEEINHRETMKALTGEVDYEFHRGEVPMEPETAEKIRVFQSEIKRLIRENKTLHQENSRLKRKLKSPASRRYSESSESSSSSSSSSDSSSDSSESESEADIERAEDVTKDEDSGKTEDTGYESTASKELTPEPDWSKGKDKS